MATEINKPVIYVVVNKALNMSPGKVAAQVGHAVAWIMGRNGSSHSQWISRSQRWLIVLEAQNGEQLYHMCEYLTERGVNHYRVIDEGVNEIAPFSITAVGVGPLDKDSQEAAYLKDLSLYSDKRDLRPPRDQADERTRTHNIGFAKGVESRKWRNRLAARKKRS